MWESKRNALLKLRLGERDKNGSGLCKLMAQCKRNEEIKKCECKETICMNIIKTVLTMSKDSGGDTTRENKQWTKKGGGEIARNPASTT